MPPKSIGTLKRKHGTLSATRESEKGGAIHASSAFAQPLWSAEEQALFNGEVARVARSTLCREALVESPQAAYAALANLRSPIDPELTKMLEIVANYVMEVGPDYDLSYTLESYPLLLLETIQVFVY